MSIPDRIERTMVLPISRQRLWEAITRPEQLAEWLGVVKEMDFRVGGQIQFSWQDQVSPHLGQIEAIEPLQHFAFRWSSYGIGNPDKQLLQAPTTLVSFTLEEVTDGTQLTLVEAGFASWPEDMPALESYQDNQQGWDELLKGLRTYLQ